MFLVERKSTKNASENTTKGRVAMSTNYPRTIRYVLGPAALSMLLMSSTYLSSARAETPAYRLGGEDYSYIIGGYVSGGYSSYDDVDGEAGRLVIGGRFDTRLSDQVRLAIIGEITRDEVTRTGGLSDITIGDNTAWASAYTYLPLSEGSFVGLETGLRTHSQGFGSEDFVKIGLVGRYSFNDKWAINAWGGALVPFDNEADILDSGAYAGAQLTHYFGSNISISGYADWSVTDFESSPQEFHSLRAGLRAEYLTSVEGLRVWGSAGYTEAWYETNGNKFKFDGPQLLVGLTLDLFGGGATPTDLKTFDDHVFNTPVYAVSGKF